MDDNEEDKKKSQKKKPIRHRKLEAQSPPANQRRLPLAKVRSGTELLPAQWPQRSRRSQAQFQREGDSHLRANRVT